MSVRRFATPEVPLKTFLRADPNLASLLGGAGGIRIYSDGIPRTEPPLPYVDFAIVDGPEDAGEAPIMWALVQFNVWGKSKGQARTVVDALLTSLCSVQGPTDLDSTLRCLGIRLVRGPRWAPDPASDRPKFDFDVRLGAIATNQAA